MKKILIGTTALIAAGLISSAANAKIANGNDNITLTISGNVEADAAFGSSSEMKNYKDHIGQTFDRTKGVWVTDGNKDQALLKDNYEKDRISKVDVWTDATLEIAAEYDNSDKNGVLQSVTGHMELVDGFANTNPEALDINVAVNTKFGNVIIGDNNFVGGMGTPGNSDDADQSMFQKEISEDGDYQSFQTTALDNNDLADGSISRIQYNTGKLIALNAAKDADGNIANYITVGASVALDYAYDSANKDHMKNDGYLAGQGTKQATDDYGMLEFYPNGDPVMEPDDDYDPIVKSAATFRYQQSASAKQAVYAGGISYHGLFGDTTAFGVATFQHTDGINMFNVSGEVGLLKDTVHVYGGMTMKMFSETDIHKTARGIGNTGVAAAYTTNYVAPKPIMSFYLNADYAVNQFTIHGDGHFGWQSYENGGNTERVGAAPTKEIEYDKGHVMELGFAADVTMALADNVNWTIAEVSVDYHKKSADKESTDAVAKKVANQKLGLDSKTAFGLKSKLTINF